MLPKMPLVAVMAAAAAVGLGVPAVASAATPPTNTVFIAAYDPASAGPEGIAEFPGDGSAQTWDTFPCCNEQLLGGMTVDQSGDVFSTWIEPSDVIEVSPSGADTYLGSLGLAQPTGVAVDAAGDLFVADAGTNPDDIGQVVEVPAGGGAQKTLASGLDQPEGLALDSAGDLFIAEAGNDRVLEIPAGTDTVEPFVSSLPNEPYALAIDGAGDLYIALPGPQEILKVAAGSHSVSTFAALPGYPLGLAVDDLGDVLVAINAGSVSEYSPSGATITNDYGGLGNTQQVAVYTSAPTFTADNAPPAPNGIPYSYTYAATGATTYSLASGTLPPGLTLDPTTGVLSGTPTTNGNYSFTVQATNGWGWTLGSAQTVTVADPVSTSFGYSAGEQTFVVPAGDTEISVAAVGAPGGSSDGTSGGFGAQLSTDLAVTPGETLYVEVGGPGAAAGADGGTAAGGFNGGGVGGSGESGYSDSAGGGGGASDIRTTPLADNNLASRLVVAGGGGGDAEDCNPGGGGLGGDAGPDDEQGYADSAGEGGDCNGTDASGSSAGGVTTTFSYTSNGTPHTIDAGGGAGGAAAGSPCTGGSGSAGTLGTGGAGENGTQNDSGGAGGGGGYYGGGGGGQGCVYSAGGGAAGSSYSAGTDTSVQTQVINGSEDSTPSITISYGRTQQVISFTSTPANASAGHSYTVAATGGGSGNAVTFAIDPASTAGACSISGAQVSFNGPGSCVIDANQAGNGTYLDAPQAQQTIAVAAAPSSAVQIDQLRLSGPGGAGDQFVELYNASSAAVPVGGWRLEGSNGTWTRLGASVSIPADGHLLFTGSGYTLGSVAAGDASLPAGIPADGGVKLLAGSTVIDAVGFAGAPAGYFTGTGLPVPATLPTDDFAWVTRYADGAPVNSSDNAADFAFVAVSASDASTSGSELGAPGPSDLKSPVVHNDLLQSSLLDPGAAESASPNQIYTPSSDGGPGTLIINRVLTNCSGQVPVSNTPCANNPVGTSPMSVTRLRFRITGLTTLGSPGAGSSQAVLQAEDSNGESNLALSGGGTASPLGLMLDSPSVSGSGGLNATWTATSLLPQGGLAAGASIDIEFEFSVAQTGTFSFAYNSEDDLVPKSAPGGGGSTDTGSSNATLPDTPPVSARLTGTVGTKSTTTPASVQTVCRAVLGSLQARPGSIRRGHRVRLQLRLSRACSRASAVTISSKAFAAHRRPARSVHAKIRNRELTLTVMVPATRRPGRYVIVARASGSRSVRIRVDVTP